jgi:hypothetical protein
MLGSLLTKWTIRLALACMVGYFAGQLLGGANGRETATGGRKFAILRWIWTVGCVLFVAHVVCAFQFTHHWSHAHAWQHTANETQRLMGFSFGDGIYFSYLFLLLWVADVACVWLGISRPTWLVLPVYLFLFFIAFNGAIVFEDGPTRPVGVLVVIALLPLVAWSLARHAGRWFQPRSEVAGPAEAEL